MKKIIIKVKIINREIFTFIDLSERKVGLEGKYEVRQVVGFSFEIYQN